MIETAQPAIYETRRNPRATSRGGHWTRQVIILALMAALVAARSLWAAELVLVPMLLIMPGLLLLRALRVPAAAITSMPAYIPGASLVVLIAVATLVNGIGAALGVAQPLHPVPLLVGFEFTCLALLAAAPRNREDLDVRWGSVSRSAKMAAPLLLPLLAAAGALRLNNGRGAGLALIVAALCCATLLWCFARASRADKSLLAMVLFCVGLALVWSFSLRGDLVYGYDITSEYRVVQDTIQAGIWHRSHPNDSFGAMASLGLLPAELHGLSGISGLLVLKVVYPMFSALFPVGVYDLTRRTLRRQWAFAAAVVVIAQQPFFQELPAIARQEPALFLFAMLVCATIEARLRRPSQLILAGLFGFAMALCHYSTTYFAICVLGVAVVGQWVWWLLRRGPRPSGSFEVAFASAVVFAVIWYGPVTHSASNLSQFVNTAETQGLKVLPNSAFNGGLLKAYLLGNTQSSMTPQQYQQKVYHFYKANITFVKPFNDASEKKYTLAAAPAVNAPKSSGIWSLISLAGLLSEQAVNLACLVGTVSILFVRRTSFARRQIGLLGLGALALLGVLRLSGTAAFAYNAARAFLQAMVVLGTGLGWTFQSFAGSSTVRQRVATVAGTALMASMLIGSTGLAASVLGQETTSNLTNSGSDYQQFVITTPELAAATWLGTEAGPNQVVYADRYGELRLNVAIGKKDTEFNDITPRTLYTAAWVYADRANIVNHTARVLLGTQSCTYQFPLRFLDDNYDVLYTNGVSEVFHR